jgi:ABC-type nitrate/sulfonate/bicarbonate transport system substrate-binding protein
MTGHLLHHGKRFRLLPAVLALILLPSMQLAASGSHAGAASVEQPPVEIHFASIANTVTGVNLEDARLAIEMITKKLSLAKYPYYRFSVDYYPDLASAAKALSNHRYHGITMTGLDYLSLRRSVDLKPLVVVSRLDQPVESFLLLSRRNETLKTIANKHQRELMVEQGGSGEMGRIWLDTLLWSRNLPESRVFFTVVRQAEKPAGAVLPVFFRQADACVVAESAFTVLKELNPQIGRRLQVLRRSPGFVRVLMCATDMMDSKEAKIITDEAAGLDKSPEGQQLLTIIQMKHLFRFEPEYLNATTNLFHRYQRRAH